ncbi:MAG TPA: flagellar export protein FliJ [Desulfuromonadaceae bacterium]|jgi:flagellar FliJ protein
MTAKRFEMEQVLRYRTEVERIRKLEFMAAKQAHEHACDRLRKEEELIDSLSKEFSDCQGALNNIEDLRLYADFFVHKREEIKDRREHIHRLDGVMNESRETLLDATKDKKVLESLKDKKAKEFRLAMSRKEQSFMDEIAVQKKENPR